MKTIHLYIGLDVHKEINEVAISEGRRNGKFEDLAEILMICMVLKIHPESEPKSLFSSMLSRRLDYASPKSVDIRSRKIIVNSNCKCNSF